MPREVSDSEMVELKKIETLFIEDNLGSNQLVLLKLTNTNDGIKKIIQTLEHAGFDNKNKISDIIPVLAKCMAPSSKIVLEDELINMAVNGNTWVSYFAIKVMGKINTERSDNVIIKIAKDSNSNNVSRDLAIQIIAEKYTSLSNIAKQKMVPATPQKDAKFTSTAFNAGKTVLT